MWKAFKYLTQQNDSKLKKKQNKTKKKEEKFKCCMLFWAFTVFTFMYVVRIVDTLIPERMQATGANTNIRRTITPWKKKTKIKHKGYWEKLNEKQWKLSKDTNLDQHTHRKVWPYCSQAECIQWNFRELKLHEQYQIDIDLWFLTDKLITNICKYLIVRVRMSPLTAK